MQTLSKEEVSFITTQLLGITTESSAYDVMNRIRLILNGVALEELDQEEKNQICSYLLDISQEKINIAITTIQSIVIEVEQEIEQLKNPSINKSKQE